MKSYKIQHDFLFASEKMASNTLFYFDIPENKSEKKRAIPMKASTLLSNDGEKMLDAFLAIGKPILLIDDLPKSNNPVVQSYSATLIKGIVTQFHEKGIRVFR